MQIDSIFGILLIKKPTGITSYDCIRHLKKVLKSDVKIGHAGTLDPFASGLLLICIGREATKLISKLIKESKEYIVKAKLGESTDTLDLTGKVIQAEEVPRNISKQEIEKAIKKLGSHYTQIPPIYSALKYQGESLHKLARKQKLNTQILEKIIKNKSREVKIYNAEILKFDPPFFTLKIHVSKGTYIRSLVDDIAQKLGLHATTYKLIRTKIGSFRVEDAIPIAELKTLRDIKQNLIFQ